MQDSRPMLPPIREMLGDHLAPASLSKPRSFSLTDLHDSLYDPHASDVVVVVPPRTHSSRGVSPPDSPHSSISSHYSSSASEWTPPSSGSVADPDATYLKMSAPESVDLSSFRMRSEADGIASAHTRSEVNERLSPSLLGLAQVAASAWAQQPHDVGDLRRHPVDNASRRRSHDHVPSVDSRYRNRLLHHPDTAKQIQHARTASLPDFSPLPGAPSRSQHPQRSTPLASGSAPYPDSRRPSISLATKALPAPPSPTLETARPRSRISAIIDHGVTGLTPTPGSITAHELRRETTEIIRYKDENGRITTTASKASTGKYGCTFCPKRFNRPSSLKIHLNTHTGEKPYQCPVPGCGRHFSVMSNMRRHQRNSHNSDELLAASSAGPRLDDMSEEAPEADMETDDDLPSRPSTANSHGSHSQHDADARSSGSSSNASRITVTAPPPAALHIPDSNFTRIGHYDGIHALASTAQRALHRQHV